MHLKGADFILTSIKIASIAQHGPNYRETVETKRMGKVGPNVSI